MSQQLVPPTRMQQAIAHVVERWKEGKTLDQIAGEYNVDPGNLSRAFRAKHHITPKHFIDQKRIAYVTEAVLGAERFGYEIGMELGFMNDVAFYRWVKRKFGVPFHELHEKLMKERHAAAASVQTSGGRAGLHLNSPPTSHSPQTD